MSREQSWREVPKVGRDPLPFDNEDVEVGEEAPAGETLTDLEVAAIRASQADPTTAPADAEVS